MILTLLKFQIQNEMRAWVTVTEKTVEFSGIFSQLFKREY